jgi:putative selenate reductase molybdopterin-binding subunit
VSIGAPNYVGKPGTSHQILCTEETPQIVPRRRKARTPVDFRERRNQIFITRSSVDNGSVVCGDRRLTFAQLAAAAHAEHRTPTASGDSTGTPRSVAFNVQGFRVAVNKDTGEIRVLKSVQAADAGVVANPMQCRGQIEGGVAQSLGAALYEEMLINDRGEVVNPKLREYHFPSFADVPRTEVYFADTKDAIGPMGAKSMSESPYNPVAAAIGNALKNATGIRFTTTPFKPDKVFPALLEKFGVA